MNIRVTQPNHPIAGFGYAGSRDRVGDNPALSKPYVWMLAALAFILLAGNAQPIWWNSFVPAILISLAFLSRRSPSSVVTSAFSPHNRTFTYLILVIDATTVLSAVVNVTFVSSIEALTRCVAPLMIYLSLVDLKIKRSDIRLIIWSMALGAAFLLLRGLVAFYLEWGGFRFNDLLWARYDQFRMSSYMSATLGNVNHMGVYVALIGPFLLAAAALMKLGRLTTVLLLGVIAMAAINAVIAGSRTGLLVFVLSALTVVARLGAKGIVLFGIAATIGLFVAAQQGLDAVSQQSLIDRFLPSASQTGVDASAIERFLSIQIGVETFVQHPFFGVGPGLSGDYNPWDIPHQSLIYVASEIGLVGGIAFLLLNAAIIVKMIVATISPRNVALSRWRLMWLIGPAHWCIFGLFGGTIFNMSVALLWIGIVHLMLALSNAQIVADS